MPIASDGSFCSSGFLKWEFMLAQTTLSCLQVGLFVSIVTIGHYGRKVHTRKV